MERETFLTLTATDDWLTAEELVKRLEAGGFWSTYFPRVSAEQRMAYTIHCLNTLVDQNDKPLFASLEILGRNGKIQRVYKQERLLRHH